MKKHLFHLGMFTLTGFTALFAAPLTASAAFSEDIWDYTEIIDEENDSILFEFKELELAIPSDWEDKYLIQTYDTEAAFYHKASKEASISEGWLGGGRMFSIHCSEALDFLYLPSYQIIGSGEEGIYYLTFPTDAQGYYKDEDIYNEWLDMLPGVDLVRSSVELTVSEETAADTFDYADDDYTLENTDEDFYENTDSEYIVEDSSIRCLTASELSHLNKEELQMGINEIYARNHRKFLTKSIQEYFDSKSWYTGTVEAAKFDETSLNQYEGKNIALMLQCMNSAPRSSGGSASQAVSSSAVSRSAHLSGTSTNAPGSASVPSVPTVSNESVSLYPTAEALTPDDSAQTEDFPWNNTGKLLGTINASDGETLELLMENGSVYRLGIGWWTSILYDYSVGDLVKIGYAGYLDEEPRLLTMFQYTEPTLEEQQIQTISGTIRDIINDFIVLNAENGGTYSFYAVPGASGLSSGEYVTISYYGSLESPEPVGIE